MVIKSKENLSPYTLVPTKNKKMATVQKQSRRKRALTMLETQLKSGVKTEKVDGKTTGNKVPLSEHDTKRLKKEIDILTQLLKK